MCRQRWSRHNERDEARPFVEIGFTALSANGYIMFGKARCRSDAAACGAASRPGCAASTFSSPVFEGEELVLPRAEPRILGRNTMLEQKT